MTVTAVAPPAGWTQTNRQDVHQLAVSIVEQFIIAHPTNVRAVWHSIPDDLEGEGPFVYIGDITEEVDTSEQLRVTRFDGTFGYVDLFTDFEEVDDRVNVFSDFFRDWISANMRTLTRGVFWQTSAADEPSPSGAVTPKAHFVIHWSYQVQEGRTPP